MLYLVVLVLLTPLVLGFLYFTAIFVKHCWTLRKFSGPFALPLVGNCYDPEVAKSIFKYLAAQRKRYGKLFIFFGFSKARLVVMDPVVARRVLSDAKAFPKGTDYTTTFAYLFGNGLVTATGDRHKQDRALFGKYFVRGNITKQAPVFNQICDHAVDDLLKDALSTNGKFKSVDIQHFFAVCALRLFMQFCTGQDYRKFPDREKMLCKVVSNASNATGLLVLFGIPPFKFLPQTKVLDKAILEVGKDLTQAIQLRREAHARGEELETEDCLNAMLEAKMGDKEMFDHMMTLICAGHDTTAYFSAYLVYLLATHQDVQTKLRAEITEHFKGRKEVTPDDLAQLSYLAKVMQETLRVYAIIPGLTRISSEEVHIKEANVTIPKGVEMLIPLSIINRDPSIWTNPSVFDPERFDGKCTDFTSAKNGFFPFGYGTRVCIGNTLAQIESGILICKLLMQAQFDLDPGFKIRIMSGISLTTKGGINVLCRPL
jgi:cytochrome P450